MKLWIFVIVLYLGSGARFRARQPTLEAPAPSAETMPQQPTGTSAYAPSEGDQAASLDCENGVSCRTFDEAKQIADCKMQKWQLQVASYNKQVSYVQSTLGGQSESDWAKHTYVQTEVDPQTGQETSEGANLIRVCVPIALIKQTYVDYKCPNGNCLDDPNSCDQQFVGNNAEQQPLPLDDNINNRDMAAL